MNLTRKQLIRVAKEFDYLAVRWSDGEVTGVNTKVGLLGLRRFPVDDYETQIQSYKPISFQEYIRIKIPFTK